MKLNPTTIDNLGMRAHQDYAKNAAGYDPTQRSEAPNVRKLAELAGTSSIYVSELKTLLGMDETPSTWAHFDSPPGYSEKTNHLFFLRPFRSGKSTHEEVEVLLKMITALPERDQKAVTTFTAQYRRISELITEAYARILALQKS